MSVLFTLPDMTVNKIPALKEKKIGNGKTSQSFSQATNHGHMLEDRF